jgi:hypothetical protein
MMRLNKIMAVLYVSDMVAAVDGYLLAFAEELPPEANGNGAS